jgi:hypothetical protein
MSLLFYTVLCFCDYVPGKYTHTIMSKGRSSKDVGLISDYSRKKGVKLPVYGS